VIHNALQSVSIKTNHSDRQRFTQAPYSQKLVSERAVSMDVVLFMASSGGMEPASRGGLERLMNLFRLADKRDQTLAAQLAASPDPWPT
jgi:hypothetical protein